MFSASRSIAIRDAAARLTIVALTSFALACGPDAPSTGPQPTVDNPLFAKASGSPTVKSANPDSSMQGTTLDVHVFGTGFESGAAATWQLNGVANPNKVRTNATTVVSSTELVANITIADTANVASWDVQVALVGGKKGIGTELFAITSKPNSPITGTPPSGARWVFGTLGTAIDAVGTVTLQPAGVFGDGLDVDGVAVGSQTDSFVGAVSGSYQDAHCGLALRIYWWDSQIASGNATLDPSLSIPSSCGSRTYNVKRGSTVNSVLGFVNVRQVMQLALNASRRQIIRFRVELPSCTRLTVGTPAADDFTATSGGVRVTRVGGTTPGTHLISQVPGYTAGEWLVESVNGKATCETQKGSKWTTTASYTGVYFRIHVTEVPPSP